MNSRIWIAAALSLALAGCSKQTTAPVVAVSAGPAATSPAGVVKRLAWALLNRDAPAYMALLTDDFRFQFAPTDSAGNAFRTSGWDRTLEGLSMQHLLVGGGAVPPASDVKLTISDLLVAQPDPRVGMNARWHKAVRTPMDLKLTFDENGSPTVTSITGYALFFVVRGDSACFLPARSAERDSTRWFISRWEDETAGASGAPGMHADPTRNTSLGMMKALYLSVPAAAR